MPEMIVQTIMTRKVITISLDDNLKKIQDIFELHNFHHLLVVEEELVGVISDRDLLRELSPFIGTASETVRDTETLNKKVHQIMTRKPVTVTKETTIQDATKLLIKKNVSCLPIVSLDGKIEGILTLKDFLKFYQ